MKKTSSHAAGARLFWPGWLAFGLLAGGCFTPPAPSELGMEVLAAPAAAHA